MRLADVAVVGGGPAGAAAATHLARAGREVVLVDKARFPRDKCCGDGLTTDALRLLEELGLDPAVVPSWQRVDDVVVRSPSGRVVTFPLPRGAGSFAAVARREELDAALVDLARDAGAEVLDGHACVGATVADDRVALVVDGVGELRARYAVGADGMWSPLRKMVGAGEPGYRGEWHAFRQYFAPVGPSAASRLHVWFEPELLPGYAWSFPLAGGAANVGFGIQRGDVGGRLAVGDMGDAWRRLLARPHVIDALGPAARPQAAHKAWPIPARIDTISLTAGRVLFAGDAAAATDPMTGEGIAQALHTGLRAAEAVLLGGPHATETVASHYETAVGRDLFADHRMAALLSRALRHRRPTRAALAVAGSTSWTRRNFARWLFEDYPRAAVATPRRWRRRLFTGPGAYR